MVRAIAPGPLQMEVGLRLRVLMVVGESCPALGKGLVLPGPSEKTTIVGPFPPLGCETELRGGKISPERKEGEQSRELAEV